MVKIVVACCGSVAAVRVPELVRDLLRHDFEVECVMSGSAQEIIHPNVLEWASCNKVITRITGGIEHVRLCGINGEAGLLLVCPATSNTISKIACGIDDTCVTTFAATALASKTKVLLVPAMHQSMYDNPFVRENIVKLADNGVTVLEPRIEEGKAKLLGNKDILAAIAAKLDE
ncbi:flavoprotein [Candidatus Altiarchaeota archaeon]